MIHIPVKISGLEKRRRSIGLLHLVAGFFLIANSESAVALLGYARFSGLAPLYIVAFVSFAYGALRNRIDPQSKANFWVRGLQAITFLSLAFAFIDAGNTGKSLGLLIWGGLAAMLALTERIALKKPEVLVSEPGISFPSGFSDKKLPWSEIESVTVRTDFLTLHFPNNRFLQFELQETLDEATTEKLQDFCRRHQNIPVVPG